MIKWLPKTASWIAILSISFGMPAVAQQTAKPKIKTPVSTQENNPQLQPATISGSVFLITKGGDIKPARMAKITLLYSHAIGSTVKRIEGSKFAADVFKIEVAKGMKDAEDWQRGKELGESLACNSTLTRGYFGAFLETYKWGSDHLSQFVDGQADEEGKFEIIVPPHFPETSFQNGDPHGDVFAPGVYLALVFGAAGYNNAFWEQEVIITPGAHISLKFSEPKMACLKLDTE